MALVRSPHVPFFLFNFPLVDVGRRKKVALFENKVPFVHPSFVSRGQGRALDAGHFRLQARRVAESFLHTGVDPLSCL